MGFTRNKKIDLGRFSAEWVNSYILVTVMSYMDKQEYEKEIRKIYKKVDKQERKIEKLKKRAETDTQYDAVEKMEDDLYKEAESLQAKVQQPLIDNFVKGEVEIDGKMQKLKAEDLLHFDEEVIKAILSDITGEVEKKD